MNDTKERMLDTSLTLFSEKGYEGTNIRELSGALGLTKTAFYKHFASKEALFRELADTVSRYYAEKFGSGLNPPAVPANAEEFRRLALDRLSFTLRDGKIVRMRKLFLTEQFRNEEIRRLATRHFCEVPAAVFSALFRGMAEKGLLKDADSDMLAFAFVSPVSMLIQLADREPERADEVLERADAFITFFTFTYFKNTQGE